MIDEYIALLTIKNGIYNFPSPYWDNISDNAVDLIIKLLTVDSLQRISMNLALELDYMTSSRLQVATATQFVTTTKMVEVSSHKEISRQE